MLLKLVLLISIFGGTWAVSCPPAEESIPCTCDEESLRIFCGALENTTEDWDIKATFDRMTPLVLPDVVFNELQITTSQLQTIPAEAIQTLKFKKIIIQNCWSLDEIHPDAFGETVNYTTILSINTQFSIDSDIFPVLSKFKLATDIDIHNIIVRSIPDEGVGALPNLKNFTLTNNVIDRIGSKAFSNLPSLEYVDLSKCEISIGEIADDAFEGIAPNVEIRLDNNFIVRLPEVPFKPLLDNAELVTVGGQDCYFIGGVVCVDRKSECDEQAAWLCQDVEKYGSKINGFLCNSADYDDIWDYCAGTSNKTDIRRI